MERVLYSGCALIDVDLELRRANQLRYFGGVSFYESLLSSSSDYVVSLRKFAHTANGCHEMASKMIANEGQAVMFIVDHGYHCGWKDGSNDGLLPIRYAKSARGKIPVNVECATRSQLSPYNM